MMETPPADLLKLNPLETAARAGGGCWPSVLGRRIAAGLKPRLSGRSIMRPNAS